jgi:hypothetical protein
MSVFLTETAPEQEQNLIDLSTGQWIGAWRPASLRLNCPLCLQAFESETNFESATRRPRRPLIVSCLHSFCEPCLQSLARTSPLVCPLDRIELRFPERGVADFPLNVALSRDINLKEESCSKPHKNPVRATIQCPKCSSLLCSAHMVTNLI